MSKNRFISFRSQIQNRKRPEDLILIYLFIYFSHLHFSSSTAVDLKCAKPMSDADWHLHSMLLQRLVQNLLYYWQSFRTVDSYTASSVSFNTTFSLLTHCVSKCSAVKLWNTYQQTHKTHLWFVTQSHHSCFIKRLPLHVWSLLNIYIICWSCVVLVLLSHLLIQSWTWSSG